MPSILLFSGPIASGKTTLANELIARHGYRRLKSSDYLRNVCTHEELEVSRSMLQVVGDRLDEETDHRWLIDKVVIPQTSADPGHDRWLIDSVRKERQVAHFRSTFPADVFHLHVWAPDEVLKQRFDLRLKSGCHHEGATSYEEAISHPNEISARALKDVADLCLDSSEIDAIAAGKVVTDNIFGGQ